MLFHRSVKHDPLFNGKVPFRLALYLLSLDLGRDNGVVNDVWSIDSVDRGHPRKGSALHTLKLKGWSLTSRPRSKGSTRKALPPLRAGYFLQLAPRPHWLC